jgi:hypothetical protein
MQLSTLVTLLPFLVFVAAAPAPQFGADKAPGNGDYKPPPIPEADKDGTFTINILGAELYEADLGDKVLGSFTGRAPIPATAPVVQRLKPKGRGVLPLPEQIYGGMFALKTDLTTAVVQVCFSFLINLDMLLVRADVSVRRHIDQHGRSWSCRDLGHQGPRESQSRCHEGPSRVQGRLLQACQGGSGHLCNLE